MAGGIAHELRNPLAVVSSSAQLLRDKVLAPEVAADCVERIFRGAMRMGGIIENLLCFARPSDQGRKTALDLGLVIREAVALLNHQPEAKTWDIWMDLPDSQVTVRGNACLLQQLLTNLLQNGVNALGNGGGRIDLVLKKNETQAILLVADTGCGISAAHLSKVFDPFFTAISVGKGTGLGLSICHTIVQQHEGNIEIASREGRGTVVKVVLPLLNQDSGGNVIPPSGKRIPRDSVPALSGERAAESPKAGWSGSLEP
jgi:signal transduction histidine kinase